MTNGTTALGTLTVERGLKLDDARGFKRACARLAQTLEAKHHEGRVRVIVEPLGEKRSLALNAYWHAVPFPMIAEYVGESVEQVKLDLMGEKWGWTISTITGHRIPVKPHTSDMTPEEASEFTEWLIPFALEMFGMEIPLPGEIAA